MNTAANIISSIRASRFLSMNALADLADVPASTISRIESGRIEPTFSMLTRIATAAGFLLESKVQEARNDQPFAAYLERLRLKGAPIQLGPARELLTVASLALVAQRMGAQRIELDESLEVAVGKMADQGQRPVISALEAYNRSINPVQSFTPVIYINDPTKLKGFKAATARSSQVMFVLPITDNVQRNAGDTEGFTMVSREWGILDALASPGRQPDAALGIIETMRGALV
jgi:transcriptional regulator with XRE-family HTH domain